MKKSRLISLVAAMAMTVSLGFTGCSGNSTSSQSDIASGDNASSASESTAAERVEGIAQRLFDDYKVGKNDVIVIISNSGRNGVVIDMALLCKERGVKVIALTNTRHTYSAESRHKSGKRLCEIADIVLDNFGCVGDACISVDGVDGKICPTSTVSGALILNAVVAEAVDICVKKGFVPEHFASANVDGGDEINDEIIRKYKEEIKHL